MSTLAEPRPVRTDARGRLSLGEPDAEFLLWQHPDGAIVLEPAVTISKVEAALLANEDLQQRVTRAHQGIGLVRRSSGRRG
ncbi:MAG: hypothetical protein LBE83_04600 [Propionibacteriaceae bacterium]|nr:hypothetical protein [Propionibacteriaceae bacterium]